MNLSKRNWKTKEGQQIISMRKFKVPLPINAQPKWPADYEAGDHAPGSALIAFLPPFVFGEHSPLGILLHFANMQHMRCICYSSFLRWLEAVSYIT